MSVVRFSSAFIKDILSLVHYIKTIHFHIALVYLQLVCHTKKLLAVLKKIIV